MSPLPIRLRLTLAFAAAMAVLLTVVGLFAYQRLAAGLADDLDRQLRQRAEDLMAPVSRPGSSLEDLTGTGFVERGESFAELLSPDGRVLQATVTLQGEALLSPAEASRAAVGTTYLDRPRAPGLNEPARYLATPVVRGDRAVVLVVGATRENGLETLRRVRTELLLGLPLLLLLSSAGGYALAGAALRPVEAMRMRAATMTAGAPGQRLPLPPGHDEIARLGATLNDLLARIDATLEREHAFVANASHELRTPLALLRTELELALRRPRPVAELTEAISSAADEVDRLIRLADDLLLLAGTDDAGLSLARTQVDVRSLLATVAQRFERMAASRGRTIEAESGAVELVEADPDRLEQALNNLVHNALQHGAGTVRLSARTAGGDVELHVTDEGDGFGPTMLEHGFERFAHSRSTGGTGLGLSIVAGVAEAHGGCAEAAGSVAGGADVWVRLPRTQATPGAAARQS